MIIENHKLKNFVRQNPEDVKKGLVAMQYLKPIDTKIKVSNLSLEDVEFIKMNLYSSNDEDLLEIISKVEEISIAEVLNIRVLKFFGLVASVKAQVRNIYKAEQQLEPNEINLKWQLVNGGEKMAKFGIYNTLEYLTDGDRSKDEYWLKQKYQKVFAIMLQKKTAKDLSDAMNKIKLASDV